MIEKATHVTIFWNLARNPEKNSSKIRRKNAKFDGENENKSEIQRGGQDTESAKAKEERDEEGGERELGPGKDAEFRESQETMRWQEMKKL